MIPLTLISPCFNEAENLHSFVENWYQELALGLDDFEMIIVDDCSNDSSPEILAELALKLPRLKVLTNRKNLKYGATITRGIRQARGDFIIWTDSDYSHKPADFWKLWKHRQAHDAVWGTRQVIQRDSYGRIFFTIGNILLIRLLFQLRLQDPNCAFKLFQRKKLLPVLDSIQIDPIMTTTKIAVRSCQMGLRVKEVPVDFLERARGKGSLVGIRQLSAAVAGVRELMVFKNLGR